jgi:hypothetical protein
MEKCQGLSGCGKEICENEKYSYFFNGTSYRLTPVFSPGLHLCDSCNQEIISRILKDNQFLTDSIIAEKSKIKIDWESYWRNSNSLRMSSAIQFQKQNQDFCHLIICLGIGTRRMENCWVAENNSIHIPRDRLGPIYFVAFRDALDYLAHSVLTTPFGTIPDVSINFVKTSIPEEQISCYIDSLRNKG